MRKLGRIRQPDEYGREAGGRLYRSGDLGRELQEIAKRGVQIVFVCGRGEPGIELLRLHAGSVVKRLGNRCRVHIIDTADHNFTYSGPRSLLEDVLTGPDGRDVPDNAELVRLALVEWTTAPSG